MGKESTVVNAIQKALKQSKRTFINVHGNMYSKSGTADIISMDSRGIFLGIEVKKYGGKVYPNQYDFLESVLKNNGRAIVLFDDIKTFKDDLVHLIDNHELPLQTLSEARNKTPQCSFELTLKEHHAVEDKTISKKESELLDSLL